MTSTPVTRSRAFPVVPALGLLAVAATAVAVVLFVRLGERNDALAAASAQGAQLGSQLSVTRRKLGELEAQLAARQTELDRALTAKLPVDVSFHLGDPGTGFVARFDNRATVELKLAVEPRRPATGEYGKIELSLAPQSSGEVGDKQGWGFKSGDTLTVNSGEFRALSLQVP